MRSERLPDASTQLLLKIERAWRVLRVPAAFLIIAAVAYFFIEPLLNFNAELTQPDREFEGNAGLVSNAYSAIREHGVFPFWNPYIHTGIPYLGDPANYFLNPIASVPGLIVGPINGPKVALLLSVALSGFSGYYFAGVLGLSWPARVWAGVMLAINGHLTARIWVGQFQLAIAFPFMVLALAFYIESLRKPGRQYPILAGASVAILLFSGLLYYFVFTLPGLLLTFMVFAAASQAGGWNRQSLTEIVRRSAVCTLWALGFAAAALIPMFETSDFVIKTSDPLLQNSQTMPNSFLNFLISDRQYFAEAQRGMPEGFMGEFYSYIGFVPALAAPFAVLALRRPDRRVLFVLLVLLFFMYLAWASAKHTPVKYVYESYTFLYNFRWTSRVLAAATPILVLLGAIGLDELLRFTMHPRLRVPARRWFGRLSAPALPAGALLAVLMLGLVAYDARDVYSKNSSLFTLSPRRVDHQEMALWLDENVSEPAFVSITYGGSPGVATRLTEHEIPHFAAIYWTPRLEFEDGVNRDDPSQIINARPHYLAVRKDEVPEQPDAVLAGALEHQDVYVLEDSPPMGSLISSRDPPIGEGPWDDRAVEADVRIINSNVIEVTATLSDGGFDTVLLLQSYFPGWRVEIDGEGAGEADNTVGYLSTEAHDGTHVYRFVFDPQSHKIGLAITAGTALGAALLGVTAACQPVRRRLAR